jgi:T4-like virus Myoviridae tail sheath stabiliser
MADFFYDGQVRKYLTQFMRVLSNFSYKDGNGNIIQVPVRYGDMNRQVAQILRKNSENALNSVPFIACYIKDINFDRERMQDPTFVSNINIRTSAQGPNGSIPQQGANYTVERLMPVPYQITFVADIWTSSTEQKLQLWEQIAIFFNPSLEIQTTDNYIDWTSLSLLLLDSHTWTNRQIPQGVEQDIDILSMTFKAPIWITPPAKVKQLGIVTKIVSQVYALSQNTIAQDYVNPDVVDQFINPVERVSITPGNYDLLILNNVATLIHPNNAGDLIDTTDFTNVGSWYSILDLYPGVFTAGYSQIRLSTPSGSEIVAYISLNPTNESQMILRFDQDTIPSSTVLNGRSSIDAIVNPETFNPTGIVAGKRYLILQDLNPDINVQNYSGPVAWKNSDGTDFAARANSIIEWNGNNWNLVFDSSTVTEVIYITNSFTGVQYKWQNGEWSKSYEGVYDNGAWRLVL